jgi:hypothetical protein
LRWLRPAGFWEQCGAACERLSCPELAKLAFARVCEHFPTSLRGHLGLARLYAAQGNIEGVLDNMTDVLLQTCGSGPEQGSSYVPRSMLATLSTLIATTGMQAVQHVLEKSIGRFHPLVENVIELAFERGTDHCDE